MELRANSIETTAPGQLTLARNEYSASSEDRIVPLFGFDIADTRLERAAAWLVQRAQHKLATNVAFINAHCVNVAFRSPDYKSAVEKMDRVFADGVGVRIAAKIAGIELQDNVNGTDLFPILCREAADRGAGIYLFGGQPGIAATAAARMIREIPGLSINGTQHGFMSGPDDETRIIEAINASRAGILLVALGVPAQEIWIARNRHRITVPVVIGVGGLFDYYSGRIARAPLPLRKAGLEWAWRLAMEPRRLARRYLLGNAEFLARLMWLRVSRPQALTRKLAA